MRESNTSRLKWCIDSGEDGTKLQEFVSRACSVDSQVAKDIIEFGCVHIQGGRIKDPAFELKAGYRVEIYLPSYGIKRFYELNPQRIIYRDKWLLAYNKEAFIPSHQVPYDDYNHVLGALGRFLSKQHSVSYVAIHNRLDLEVSGVLLFSLDRSVNAKISQMFSSHTVKKAYLLWAEGNPPGDRWMCDKSITKKNRQYTVADEAEKGKIAKTHFTLVHRKNQRLLILAEPMTGRTHQIRLHILASGLRLYGDRLYGGPPANRIMLHGWRMELKHPKTGKKIMLEATVPEDFFGGEFFDEDLPQVLQELTQVFK